MGVKLPTPLPGDCIEFWPSSKASLTKSETGALNCESLPGFGCWRDARIWLWRVLLAGMLTEAAMLEVKRRVVMVAAKKRSLRL